MLGSVQMIVLGVIGEYLGRLYAESKGRPNFIIREVVGRAEQPYADPASIAPIANHLRYRT
jgi:dolichol-phosphate mannosyltransferase